MWAYCRQQSTHSTCVLCLDCVDSGKSNLYEIINAIIVRRLFHNTPPRLVRCPPYPIHVNSNVYIHREHDGFEIMFFHFHHGSVVLDTSQFANQTRDVYFRTIFRRFFCVILLVVAVYGNTENTQARASLLLQVLLNPFKSRIHLLINDFRVFVFLDRFSC